MSNIDSDWLRDFNAAKLVFFAINHEEAGMDEGKIHWYVDSSAEEAALVYGWDFDLCRVDMFWG